MLDAKGNRLQASRWAGFAEKYGITNSEVIMSSMGWVIDRDVTFEKIEYNFNFEWYD